MDNKRNRELIEYLISSGITMSVCKNKARGNKGYFKATKNPVGAEKFIITISKGMTDDEITRVLVHEFTHYFHYQYDKTLKSIDFFLGQNLTNDLHEELLRLTVDIVPKDFATNLFTEKDRLNSEINMHVLLLKENYPNIQKSKPLKEIENKIKKSDFKYLLKYDKVRICSLFTDKIYTIESLKELVPGINNDIVEYLTLKSKQRILRRINGKITKLNKYYCSCTEIFARSMEVYLCYRDKMKKLAPQLCTIYDKRIKDFPIFNKFVEIFAEKRSDLQSAI